MTYSTSFLAAVSAVIQHEGVIYECDPRDPGGATRFGISSRSYPTEDIANMTEARAVEIYHRDFWSPMYLDALPSSIAAKLLDMAVNLGEPRAVMILQEALCYLNRSVKIDGKLGPQTRTAVMGVNKAALLAALCGRQFGAYERIIIRNPDLQPFASGWAIRAMWRPA